MTLPQFADLVFYSDRCVAEVRTDWNLSPQEGFDAVRNQSIPTLTCAVKVSHTGMELRTGQGAVRNRISSLSPRKFAVVIMCSKGSGVSGNILLLFDLGHIDDSFQIRIVFDLRIYLRFRFNIKFCRKAMRHSNLRRLMKMVFVLKLNSNWYFSKSKFIFLLQMLPKHIQAKE